MMLRKLLFWLHLSAGSLAGVVILTMSVTGVFLAFERQINNWADRGFRHAPPRPGAPTLPIEALLAQLDGTPTTLTLKNDPDAPAGAEFGRQRIVYLNPYSGVVLGEGSQATRAFFQQVEQVHRWLAFSAANRATGRLITGSANLLFLFLVSSGIYLWWPRAWTRQHLRPAIWFRSGLRGRARDWNWHNTTGIWCAVPLFCIVFSGVIMSFPWANNLLFKAAGSPPPIQNANARAREGRRGSAAVSSDGLNVLWAKATQQVPEWRSIGLRLPESPRSPVSFAIDSGDGGRPDLRSTLTLDRKTGAVVRWEPFSSFNRGRQLRSWVRFGHTGEAGGIVGQIIACIAAAGGAVLVCSGIALALRRLLAAKSRRLKRSQPQDAKLAVR